MHVVLVNFGWLRIYIRHLNNAQNLKMHELHGFCLLSLHAGPCADSIGPNLLGYKDLITQCFNGSSFNSSSIKGHD